MALRARRPIAVLTLALVASAAIAVGVSQLGGTEAPTRAATVPGQAPAEAPAAVTTASSPALPPDIAPAAGDPPPARPTIVQMPEPSPTATPKPAAAAKAPVTELPFEGSGPLPVDSPLDLPPMLQVSLPPGSAAPVALTERVLRSRALAIAPGARRSITGGLATAPTLELLTELAGRTSPLLVFRARAGTVRVQATTLAGTRDLVRWLGTHQQDAALSLHPVPRDFADVAQSAADARVDDIGAEAARVALTAIGIPYSWGGGNAAGPSPGTCAGYHGSIKPCPATRTVGFDCSGLMLFAYAAVGVTLDHYAAFQWLEGRRISSRDLAPGDLVFFHPKADGPGHVGMYIGDGRFVQAPRTGDVVKVSELADPAYSGSYMGAVRPY